MSKLNPTNLERATAIVEHDAVDKKLGGTGNAVAVIHKSNEHKGYFANHDANADSNGRKGQ